MTTSTLLDRVEREGRLCDVALDLGPQRTAHVVVSETCTVAWPAASTVMSPTMPSSTMEAPSSGSSTCVEALS